MITITLTVAALGDVLGMIFGVMLGLCGIAVMLLGILACVDRAWKHGLLSTLGGAACLAAGLWLFG